MKTKCLLRRTLFVVILISSVILVSCTEELCPAYQTAQERSQLR